MCILVRNAGRIKELIITAGGENVAPIPIEDAIKSVLPLVGGVMLIGDQRKYLLIMMAVRTELDPDSLMPTDRLQAPGKDFLKECCGLPNAERLSDVYESGLPPSGTFDATARPVLKQSVREAVQRAIDTANERAVSRAQKVQKFVMVARDFSIPGGELGPTLKLRRPVVLKIYKELIEYVYAEPPPAGAPSAD